MKNLKLQIWLTRLAGTSFMLLMAFVAQAQDSSDTSVYAETKHTIIFKQPISAKGFTDKAVEMMIVDFPPRSRSLAHRHPCPTIGYVVSGSITSVFDGKTYHYNAGDSFYEIPNGLHSDARNDSFTTPAKLLVTFLKDKNIPTIVPAGGSH